MPTYYTAICLKEIYWPEKNGSTYKIGDPIKVTENDARILTEAGVIGDLKRVSVETATITLFENAKRPYQKKRI